MLFMLWVAVLVAAEVWNYSCILALLLVARRPRPRTQKQTEIRQSLAWGETLRSDYMCALLAAAAVVVVEEEAVVVFM